MDRGGRGMRRTRGGRPFIRGYYRGRTPGRKGIRYPMGNRSRTSDSRDKYESSSYNDNDRSDACESSWDSPTETDKDNSKEKHEGDNSSPISRSKWDNDEDTSEKNDDRYPDKKNHYNDSKYYRRPTGNPFRGQRRPYQNNYWERNDRGRHYSPQSQYRVRPYHSPPRHRHYSRSPDRRRSPTRYRSRSHTPNRSRHFSPPKHRSPRRKSQSRRPRSPIERSQSIEKSQAIKNTSDNENNSDDFVEKLKASKNSKTPGRTEYTGKSDDEYWVEADKINEYNIKDIKKSNRPELSSNDNDDYWVKSQTSKASTKNIYSNSWDDSPVREKSVPKAPKTPGRKDYSSKDNDDYWINSPSKEYKKDRSTNDLYQNKIKNKDSTTMYVQELSSSDSEQEKTKKRTRSMSLTNSDKSETPPLNTEQSNKLETRYSQAPSRGSINVLKEPPPPSIPVTPSSVPVYSSQWPGVQNATTSFSSTANYSQPQASQFTAYQQQQQQQQQQVPVQSSQWYPPSYQQYGTQFQQFQQYDQKPVSYNPVHSNLEPVEGYQSTNQGLYNIDLKQVVDITKPPPTITPITPVLVPDIQSKSSQDKIFEMQRETYNTKLLSLKKELESLQIHYDKFKSDNADGRYNNELKNNRKAQDDINRKIKGVNNIIEVLSTMISKDSMKETKQKTESEYLKTQTNTLPHEEVSTEHKHKHHSISSSSSVELKQKRNKSKKSSKVLSSGEEETYSKKSYKSKEITDTRKKKKHSEKPPQFNYVYCDSCIHWCQSCNIFPKTAKEYLTHLQSESHKTTLEELNNVELPWHDTQNEPNQPETNPELPTKRVPIKGLEFFIGTNAWYCKLCDTWIGDLHCASAHFKSKRHNELYAELIAREPNWEIDWLTKRTRAFEKSVLQINTVKHDVIKEDKSNENIVEPKTEKSFFDKEPKKDREKNKICERERDREKERDRERDRNKKEINRKTTELKNQLSPDKSNDTNNVSISDWMKPVNLPVDKSMIILKESVQKSKDKLHKNKTDEVNEYKSSSYNDKIIKKQKLEDPKPAIYEKKDEVFNSSNRNKIKLPFIGKMPFAKPVSKKPNSSIKDVPNFNVERITEEPKEPKENLMDSVAIHKMFMEKIITAANENKIEKQILPIDMDIDDENENNEAIINSESDLVQSQIPVPPRISQIFNQSLTPTSLPEDLNSALNMLFPCNEPSSVMPSMNTPINHQVHNPLLHQQNFNVSYDMANNLSISPERKKKKNAPSQRKRRHMKKVLGKEEESTKDDYDDNDKSEATIYHGPIEEGSIRKSNGNESEGDELAMLGIDAEDMAAQYY